MYLQVRTTHVSILFIRAEFFNATVYPTLAFLRTPETTKKPHLIGEPSLPSMTNLLSQLESNKRGRKSTFDCDARWSAGAEGGACAFDEGRSSEYCAFLRRTGGF